MYEEERAEVAAAARRIAAEGLVVGSAGNVGRRVGDVLLMTATGARLAELAAGDVAVIALDDGRRLAGPPPSTELPLHICAFRHAPDRRRSCTPIRNSPRPSGACCRASCR